MCTQQETLAQETVTTTRSRMTSKKSETILLLELMTTVNWNINTATPHPKCCHLSQNWHHITVAQTVAIL